MYYVDWRDRFNEIIFEDPGVGNYTCSIMAGQIPVSVNNPEPKINVEEQDTSRLTREEKIKNKTKQLK